MARFHRENVPRSRWLLNTLILIALLACEFSQPLPTDNSDGAQPPPAVPTESERDAAETESVAATELTEQQRAVLQQIVDLYASQNLPCPYDEAYFLEQALAPNRLAKRHAAIVSHLSADQLEQVRFALSLTPALLGEQRSQEVLWELDVIGQSESALESPTVTLLGTVDPLARKISFTREFFDQGSLQQKLTFLHELLHLLDLAPQLFDTSTLLELKLIVTQFIFENGGPDILYEQLYLEQNHASQNYISALGSLFVDRLEDFLPADHEQTGVIIAQVETWKQERMEQVVHFQLGQLLLDTRRQYSDFQFSEEGEALLRQVVRAMTIEAFADALSLRTSNALAFDQTPEQSLRNAQLIVRYFNVAGGQHFATLAEIQDLLYGNGIPWNTPSLSVDEVGP